MNSPVTVLEVRAENVQELCDLGFNLTTFLEAHEQPSAKVGDGSREAQLNGLLQAWAAKATTAFFLRWTGSKVPRGAVIRGKVVAWTQNGLVVDEAGETIGTYSRLVEFGPKDEQQMLVHYIGKRL